MATASILGAMVACGAASPSAAPPIAGPTTEQLVWSDEFTSQVSQAPPDPTKWTYDTGGGGWGNGELETYCAYGMTTSPCNTGTPNVYVASDGYLHILAQKNAQGQITSARLKTEGIASFQYGRFEARIQIPGGQGTWPAFWMLGNSISSQGWPACGELDIMENIGKEPGTVHGSIHGTGFTGSSIGLPYVLPNNGVFAGGFHTFGMIWSPKLVQYYVDLPSNVYASFTPSSLPAGAVWPFDGGDFFFIMNLAIGGNNSWPGAPDATTVFPVQMLVDYVRVWKEPSSTASALK